MMAEGGGSWSFTVTGVGTLNQLMLLSYLLVKPLSI
jgi:hypothetical protein